MLKDKLLKLELDRYDFIRIYRLGYWVFMVGRFESVEMEGKMFYKIAMWSAFNYT